MAKIALSDAGLRSLKPPLSGQESYWDKHLAGFGVRVSQGGSKTFVLKHKNQLTTLGRVGIVSLSEARGEAKRLLAEYTLGKVRPQSITYDQAVDLFLADKEKARRARTIVDYKRLLKRLAFKGQLSDISPPIFSKRISKFPHKGEYNHLLVASKVFWNWCIKRRYTTENPTLGLSTHTTQSRTRVLTDAELLLIWKACEQEPRSTPLVHREGQAEGFKPNALPFAFRKIVQLLILTGQRRGEIAALRAEYFSNDLCTLPSTLTKNKREHQFPVGALASSVLASVKNGGSGILFPARGTKKSSKPFNGWSKSKAILDEISGVKNWTLHDLRRTFATRLAEMGTAPHVIERLLNHAVGSLSPIALVYNKATYLEEMRQAIGAWEAHISKLLSSR